MEFLRNAINDLKSREVKYFIKWGIAVFFVIVLFPPNSPYPMNQVNFAAIFTIFFLFVLIHGNLSEINKLKRMLKERDEAIEAIIKEDCEKSKIKTYVEGTKRARTELDNYLDKFILDKYYEEHKVKRTLEKDKEILEKSYLIEK